MGNSSRSSRQSLLADDEHWAAPLLWRSEFRNILAGYLRRKIITCPMAQQLQEEAEGLLAGSEYEVDSRLGFAGPCSWSTPREGFEPHDWTDAGVSGDPAWKARARETEQHTMVALNRPTPAGSRR